jgi:hypothetical protein
MVRSGQSNAQYRRRRPHGLRYACHYLRGMSTHCISGADDVVVGIFLRTCELVVVFVAESRLVFYRQRRSRGI